MANTGGANPQVMTGSGKDSSMGSLIRGYNLGTAMRAQEDRAQIFTDCMRGKGWYLIDAD